MTTNRETQAFNMHWHADQGLYAMVLDFGFTRLVEDPEISNEVLGDAVVRYVKEITRETLDGNIPGDREFWQMIDREVGSWDRIDHETVGEQVREGFDVENMLTGVNDV